MGAAAECCTGGDGDGDGDDLAAAGGPLIIPVSVRVTLSVTDGGTGASGLRLAPSASAPLPPGRSTVPSKRPSARAVGNAVAFGARESKGGGRAWLKAHTDGGKGVGAAALGGQARRSSKADDARTVRGALG